MLRQLALLSLAAGLAGLHGCGCNDMGCVNDTEFHITIIGKEATPTTQATPLPAGTYVINVATDTETATFQCVVAAPDSVTCDHTSISVSTAGPSVRYLEAAIDIDFFEIPRTATVTVSLDGVQVASKTYQPSSVEVKMTGSCMPACHAVEDPVMSVLP